MNKYNLIGKFHSHITIKKSDINKAEKILNSNKIKYKTTIIELSDFSGREQEDAMITQHFHTRRWNNYKKIEDYLFSVVNLLSESGISVLRLKIEHEDVDYDPDVCAYIEAHIKIRVKKSNRDDVLLSIKKNNSLNGYMPSRNPNEVTDEYCHQFINKRWYSGSYKELKLDLDNALKEIKLIAQIKEVKVESALFDSNNNLDKWWS